MRKIYKVLVATILLTVAACGSEQNKPASPETATTRSNAVPQPPPVVASESIQGQLAFTVDGHSKVFEHFPRDRNHYSKHGSGITAKSSAGATETFAMTFLSIDLAALQYPIDLPPRKDISKPMDPRLAMANVGISYIDEEGNEWAGPVKMHIKSFSEGVVSGSFKSLSLRHTDKSLPALELSEGEFSARLQ